MDAIDNLRQVKNNWETCSKWEIEQQKNDACFEEIKKRSLNSESSIFARKGKTLLNAINTMDQIGINKSENALVTINGTLGIAVQVLGAIGWGAGYLFSKLKNAPGKTPKMAGFIGMSLFMLIGSTAGSFLSSHFAKTATRIARYQTRNNELKDVRNFVGYTDEQIDIAKTKLSTVKEVKDITEDMSIKESSNPIKVLKKSFETIDILNKDYEKYKAWREEYLKNENIKKEALKNIKLTVEEQKTAEKDKNFLLNTIRKMDISANNYEINVGFTVRTLAALLSSVSLGGSFALAWGLGKLSRGKNGILFKTIGILSKLSIPAGIAGMILLAGPLLKIAKDSAMLGRFKEKSKLLSDEKNFYPYTDKEIDDIKKSDKKLYSNKTIWQTIIDDFKFIPQIRKDYKEYLTYKKDKRQEELKLEEVLKTMPISDEQLKDAKKLQQQAFMAFEKIDDKSECLVDDTNAAVSSASALINLITGCVTKIATLVLFGKEVSKFTKTKEIPGFWEGLKLSKNLSFKKMTLIFIVPFIISKAVNVLTALAGTEVKKKACKIGIMSAMDDLNEPKKFVPDKNITSVFSNFNNAKQL